MQLTKHTDYAFRTLIFLAANREQLSNIQDIADTFELSKSHLMKVVNKMVNVGWLESVRGKNGGIRLAREPHSIGVAEVVREMEHTLEPINCHTPTCTIVNDCTLKPILWQAQQAYLNYLKKFTLADVVNDPTLQVLKFG